LNPTRRNIWIAAAAVVVIAAGVFGYFTWARGSGGIDSSGKVALTDLLKPGSLPDMVMGADNAPVTIVEYASLTCPHCQHFELTTYPELKKRYIDTGKVRYIFREFVLNDLDALAIMLARCLDKDKYFPFVETLYATQDKWAKEDALPPLMAISKQAGFTDDSFKKCAANQQLYQDIAAQRDTASKNFGVNSTPTFFINGQIHSGDMPLAELEKLMQPYLSGK
jgi:protein-disulfide isomerase